MTIESFRPKSGRGVSSKIAKISLYLLIASVITVSIANGETTDCQSIQVTKVFVPRIAGLSKIRVLWTIDGVLYYPSSTFPHLLAYDAEDDTTTELHVEWRGKQQPFVGYWENAEHLRHEIEPIGSIRRTLYQDESHEPTLLEFDFSEPQNISVKGTPLRLERDWSRNLQSILYIRYSRNYLIVESVDSPSGPYFIEQFLDRSAKYWVHGKTREEAELERIATGIAGNCALWSEWVYLIDSSGIVRHSLDSRSPESVVPMDELREITGVTFDDPWDGYHLVVLGEGPEPSIFFTSSDLTDSPKSRSGILKDGDFIEIYNPGALIPVRMVGPGLFVLASWDSESANNAIRYTLRDAEGTVHFSTKQSDPNRWLAFEWLEDSRTAVVYLTPKARQN